MSEDAFIRVVKRAQADLLAKLRGDGPKRRWWLSFAADEFLGACSVEAPTFLAAVKVAHALGINPGGECLGIEVPAGLEGPARFHDRLLTKAEADEFVSETGISGGLVDCEADDVAKSCGEHAGVVPIESNPRGSA